MLSSVVDRKESSKTEDHQEWDCTFRGKKVAGGNSAGVCVVLCG